MKVLMVNTYDIRGGAARSALRVYQALKSQQVDVKLMVQNKWGDDDDILGPSGRFNKMAAELRPYLDFAITFPWHRRRIPFFPAYLPGNFIRRVKKVGPDIIHLNWITGGFVRLESLAEINVPIVWTLHDMWAFTGGCHYAEECTRYEKACGACPILISSKERDLSRWIFNRKIETYRKIRNLTIITPSHWLAGCVRRSPLLGGFPVEIIPNSLDTGVFFPENKALSRNYFGFAANRKIILFGALDATKNRLKGFIELSEALQLIPDKKNIELAVFGSAKRETTSLPGFNARYFGHIADDGKLRKLYSAADVMVVPSIQEVFGQTATEAMACGTPVVAFGATGLLDIVEHKVNGYLAEPFKPEDLAAGILWCLENRERNRQLSSAAVETVKNKFDMKKNVQRFISLYERLTTN
ncbi:MAG: glycosyltransferase family 4 protein [Bacteroidales bacterium]|nr:glycosyltransferase family 4 protein [Bacteroidales bacterium]